MLARMYVRTKASPSLWTQSHITTTSELGCRQSCLEEEDSHYSMWFVGCASQQFGKSGGICPHKLAVMEMTEGSRMKEVASWQPVS